jgi:hypothetical protein
MPLIGRSERTAFPRSAQSLLLVFATVRSRFSAPASRCCCCRPSPWLPSIPAVANESFVEKDVERQRVAGAHSRRVGPFDLGLAVLIEPDPFNTIDPANGPHEVPGLEPWPPIKTSSRYRFCSKLLTSQKLSSEPESARWLRCATLFCRVGGPARQFDLGSLPSFCPSCSLMPPESLPVVNFPVHQGAIRRMRAHRRSVGSSPDRYRSCPTSGGRLGPIAPNRTGSARSPMSG